MGLSAFLRLMYRLYLVVYVGITMQTSSCMTEVSHNAFVVVETTQDCIYSQSYLDISIESVCWYFYANK